MFDEGLQMDEYAMLVAEIVPSDLQGHDGRDTEARHAAMGVLSVKFAAAQSQRYSSLLRDMAAQNRELSYRQQLQAVLAFPNLTRQDANGVFDFDPDPQANGVWASYVSVLCVSLLC